MKNRNANRPVVPFQKLSSASRACRIRFFSSFNCFSQALIAAEYSSVKHMGAEARSPIKLAFRSSWLSDEPGASGCSLGTSNRGFSWKEDFPIRRAIAFRSLSSADFISGVLLCCPSHHSVDGTCRTACVMDDNKLPDSNRERSHRGLSEILIALCAVQLSFHEVHRPKN